MRKTLKFLINIMLFYEKSVKSTRYADFTLDVVWLLMPFEISGGVGVHGVNNYKKGAPFNINLCK